MKKSMLWSLFSLLLISSLVLAACGPAGTTETEAPPPPTQAPTPVPAEPTKAPTPEPEADLVIWADETRAPILERLAADFESEYGVGITIQQMGFGDVRDQVKVAGPAGEGPDIFIGAHDWLGELVANGVVAEMDLGAKEGDFAEVALGALTWDGVLYGMPYAIENVAFFYNTELVPEAPETWEEVEQIASDLKARGEVTQGYLIQTNDPYHYFPLMTAYGGYVFGGYDATGAYDPSDVGIDSAGAIAAAEWLEGMVDAGNLDPQVNVDYDVMHTLFEQGDAAMIVTGPWALERIRASGVPYAITTIPAGPAGAGRPFLGVQGFFINAFSENMLLAQTFLNEFVATPEIMQELQVAGGRPSAYLPVMAATDDPDLVAFGAAGVNALPMPAIPEMSSVWTAWGDAMELVRTAQQDALTAFQNAAEQIRTLIGGG